MKPIKSKPMFNKKEEKRNKILMFIFAIIFFSLAYITSYAQPLVRTSSYDVVLKQRVTTLAPPSKMNFGVGDSESSITIESDSIGHDIYSVYLSVVYPKNVEVKVPFEDIFIDFDNGKRGSFPVARKYKDNRVEYQVVPETLKLLAENNATHIILEHAQCYLHDEKNKDYFKRFLVILK